MTRWLCVGQGVYYALAGLWPLISIRTFLLVTGPKSDLWLVNTVALLVLAIGLTLLLAALERRVPLSIAFAAAASAAALGGVDVYYALRGVIWPIYLLDCGPEALLVLGWMVAVFRDRLPTKKRAETNPPAVTG